MSLKTLVPDAAGDTNQWTGTYANIDDAELSDADTIYTDQADNDIQFNLSSVSNIVNASCIGVKVVSRMAGGEGSNFGLQSGIKTNSVIHLGDTKPFNGVWETVEEFYDLNPETLSQFTLSELENLQIAFRSKAIS